MHKTLVINAVGLTPGLLGPDTPNLNRLVERGRLATVGHVTPAVTCAVQATYLTGTAPAEHGIVGNGWYFRDTSEVRFWLQYDKLVQRPRLWDLARKIDPTFTCANLFWWYAMYSSADCTVTPRPMYPADGRKLPDVWTNPPALRTSLQQRFGQFPLFKFWGPMTSIESTRWIADAAMAVDEQFHPTLTLVYLPHLDYCHQRLGPTHPACANDLRELDEQIGRLLKWFDGARAIVLSEYGIVPVSRPIHINRMLRRLNLLRTRDELGREILDAGASRAFAVADHQIAHIYINDPEVRPLVLRELQSTPGIAHVYVGDERSQIGLNHPRAGDVIAVAEPDAWFTYYFWLHDARAPDYARTVDIHRKPGYDPAELFIDPAIRFPKLKIARRILGRKLGFRNLLDVIPLDATLVKGSHGAPPPTPQQGPLFITSEKALLATDRIEATDVCDTILKHLQ
jgi:predicted AlkP superfamily pyrophosphatase or phosphodiesterase